MGKQYLQTEVEAEPREEQDAMFNERKVASSNPSKKLNTAVKNRLSGTPKQLHREVLQPDMAK